MLSTPAKNPALPGDRVVPWDRAGCTEPAVRAGSPHRPAHTQTEAHSGEDQDLGQQSLTQENFATACKEGLQHTLPKPPCSSVGQRKKALAAACLVSPYCTTGPGKMSGLAMSSGNSTCTRAKRSSSRGIPPPCHPAPVGLHPLLGNEGGWSCTASSRGICSSDRGM